MLYFTYLIIYLGANHQLLKSENAPLLLSVFPNHLNAWQI